MGGGLVTGLSLLVCLSVLLAGCCQQGEDEQEEEEEGPMVVGSVSLPELCRLLEPHWRRMKLRPRLEWVTHPRSYVLQV